MLKTYLNNSKIYIDELENLFNCSSKQKRKNLKKRMDIELPLKISFVESLHGVCKDINIQKITNCSLCKGSRAAYGSSPANCWSCSGKGFVNFRDGPRIKEKKCEKCEGKGQSVKHKCNGCGGSGTQNRMVTETIEIPERVLSGFEVELPERGNVCTESGKRGKLRVTVEVEESEVFERKGSHIFSELEVTYAQAALGASSPIETIWGTKKITYKSINTQKPRMTLKDFGLYNPKSGKYGNHYVFIKMCPPVQVSEPMLDLYKKLKALDM